MEQKKKRPRTRGNGQGTAFKRGSLWTAQVTIRTEKDESGKITKRQYRTKSGFKTKREALAYTSELLNGPAVDSSRITFAGMYELWSKPHYAKLTRDTINGYKAAYSKCGSIEARIFADLKTADLQKVIDEAMTLPKRLKDGTIKPPEELSTRAKADIQSLFCNLYKYAIQNDYVVKNYSEFVKLPPRQKSKKKDAFTKEERDALWRFYEKGHVFTGLILIMCYTGMRYGEISIIKKDNIHMEERYIIGGIKSEAGRNREIPIREEISPIIRRFLSESISSKDIAPTMKICDTDSKLFIDLPEKKFYTMFYWSLDKAGVRGLSPHCCRHTCATMLMESGAPAAVITAIMGHEDISTTMGYTHIKLADKLQAVNSLPR